MKEGGVYEETAWLLSKGSLVRKHLLVRQSKKEVTKMNKTLTLIVLLLSISLINQASAVTGTYVEVTPFNTVAVDGTEPWYSTDSVAGLWYQRGFGNEGTIYQGKRATDPDLKTTISDLIPGQTYDIYAIYWSKSAHPWGIFTGLDPDPANATWYAFENGTETGPYDVAATASEMEALVGAATADKEGEIDIYVFTSYTSTERTWVDGFSYKQVFQTYNPQPAHQAESVALDSQLSWSTMLDPCNPTQPHPEVTEHWVYFGETPYLTPDHLLTKVPVSTEQVSPPPLEANKWYYWCVDEHFADGSRVLNPIWMFETIWTLPIFFPPLGSQPQDVFATEGETIMFTAAARTPAGLGGPINYQWYKGLPGDTSSPLSDEPEHISGAQSNELTIIMEPADEASYFCRATNDAGTEDSEAATLLLKRLLAWYKFDDNLNDSAGTNNGTMTNPIYVDGIDGKALSFDGTNYVNLGTDAFPKTGVSNGLETGAVSFWINFSGAGYSFAGTYNNGDTTSFEVWYSRPVQSHSLDFRIGDDNNTVLSSGIGSRGSILDAWHLITCTWDTGSGEAAIYQDGVSLGLVTSSLPSEFAEWQYPMIIGACQNRNTVENFYVGAMDDYRVYNYSLDPYEVAELYTSLAGGEICVQYPIYDFNQDCKVDRIDLAIFAEHWLECNLVPETACEYPIGDPNLIDINWESILVPEKAE